MLTRYITEADLQFFKDRVEGACELKGAGPWEHMVSKDFGNFTYEAYRRWLPVGAGKIPQSAACSLPCHLYLQQESLYCEL